MGSSRSDSISRCQAPSLVRRTEQAGAVARTVPWSTARHVIATAAKLGVRLADIFGARRWANASASLLAAGNALWRLDARVALRGGDDAEGERGWCDQVRRNLGGRRLVVAVR